MEMSTVMNSVISLFLIMLAGVYGTRKGIINGNVCKGLTNILLEIALPCMIITSFSFSHDEYVKANIIKAFYYSLAVYIIMIILSKFLLLPVGIEKKTILHFANIFTNTGYIGFPILNIVHGKEAVMYGSIFNMFFVVFLWTYGITIFKGGIQKNALIKEIYKTLKNPSLIAVYIGLLMLIFDLKLPIVILSSANAIGNMTGPISMIIVGALMCNIRVRDYLSDWTIYYGIAVRLIIIPLVLYVISQSIGDRSMVSNSIIILASMPAAAMTSIFADSFNIQREYAAIIVVATTLLSIFTLPFLLELLI